MEKLTAAGFATTAHVIGSLAIETADRDKLCETILLEHTKALTAPSRVRPDTPTATSEAAAKVKSEAPTPAAERDSSPLIAKMSGECLFCCSASTVVFGRVRGNQVAAATDGSLRSASLIAPAAVPSVFGRGEFPGTAWQV